jgi:PAS domain S-box-containing protein
MNTKRLQLLIVEDEEAHIEAIRRAFDLAGAKADLHTAGTLREYRAQAAAHPPDLALIDLNLPDGRAVEVLTHPPADAPFPILVMTAFGNQQIVVEVMKAGALDYVVKSPEAFAALPRTVEQLLREWKLLQDHKRAEADLRIKNQVFEDSIAAQSIADKNGVITHVNPAFRRLWGYGTKEQAIGNSVGSSFADPDDAIPVLEALAAHDAWQGEFRAKRVDGTTFLSRGLATSLRNAQGELVGYQSANRDITIEREAEEKLAESEKKFRALFETMSEGIVFMDHDGKIVSANPAAERLLGLSLEQMQGRTSLDPRWKAIHADGSPFPGETHSLHVAAKTGKPAIDEVMGIYTPKTDTYVWLSVNSTPEFLPGEKKPFRAYAVFRDITERKRAEESLRQSEARTVELARFNQAVLDALSANICVLAEDGTILAVNESWRLFAAANPPLSAKAGVGANYLAVCEAVRGEDARTAQEVVRDLRALARGEAPEFSLEYPCHSPDTERWFILRATRFAGTGPMRLVVAHTNITERKRAEEEIRTSQSLLGSVLNSSRSGIMAFKSCRNARDEIEDFEWQLLNSVAEQLVGRTQVELVGRRLLVEMPGNRTEGLFDLYVKVVETGVPLNHEHYYEHEKVTTWYHTFAVKLGDGFVVTFADITARRQAETALQEKQALLTQAEELGRLGGWEFDIETRRQTWTKTVYDIHELVSPGHPTVDHGVNFYTPESRPIIAQAVQRAIEQGEPFDVELEIITAKGNRRSVHAVGKADLARHKVSGFIQDITERKQTEAALRTSEHQYRELFEAAGDALLLIASKTGRILDANNMAMALYGCERDELLARQSTDLSAEPEETSRLIQEAQSKPGQVFHIPLRLHRKKNGTLFPVEITARSLVRAGQSVLLVACRDITERQRMEAELARLNAHHELILSSAAEGIVGQDLQGNHTFVNPAAARMLGYTVEELIGRPSHSLWHHTRADGSPYPKEACNICAAFQDGKVHHSSDEVFWRKDGTRFPVEYDSTPIHEAGRLVGAVLTFMDITDRKQTEERARSQAKLLDLAQDAIAVQDLNGLCRYWNKSYERISGWSAAEAVGQSIVTLVRPDPKVLDRANRMLLEQGQWRGELGLVTRDGCPLTMMSRWTLVYDQHGQPKSVLIINTDITEQKKLEAQFLRAQRLEGLGALASGIAHDLNNILSPVLMIAPLLRDRVTDADGREMLDTIGSCAQHGADIIKQLLTFARGTTGARVPLPVKYLLRELEQLIRETFARDVRPRAETPPDIWPLLGDATQVHQALMNLCVNARDAMPDGGTLTIEAKNVTVDEAFAAMSPGAKPGSYVCVSVADTGTGIPPENLDRIFDPFFTTKEVGKGTGLGLATVLGIVRGHEGFVRVDSRQGQGTIFALYFPALLEAQATPTMSREATPPKGHGELILVVDDEPSVREGLRRTLQTHGYAVVTAAQGAEGLAVFFQHRASVRAVLTDMMMPVMNGPAMINALRTVDARLLILGMSGLLERKEVKGFEHIDLPVLLAKPFSGDELLRVLRSALEQAGVAATKGDE